MARSRYIKPAFFKDEDLAALPALTRILFAGLWGLADKYGRLEDRPKFIKVEVLPYDKVDIVAMLTALERARFITRYEVDGRRYLQVRTFTKHQRISGAEAKAPTTIPAPPTWLGRTEDAPPIAHIPPENDEEALEKHTRSTKEAPEKHLSARSTEYLCTEYLKEPTPPPPASPGPDLAALFERWWGVYPKKTKRQDALRAFKKLKPTPALVDAMLAALAWQATSLNWTKDGRQFCPYPATWLNARQWEDDRGSYQFAADPYAHLPYLWRCKTCGEIHEATRDRAQAGWCPKAVSA